MNMDVTEHIWPVPSNQRKISKLSFQKAANAVVASRKFVSLPRKIPGYLTKMGEVEEDLCIGDIVCLYSEDTRGFVFALQSNYTHNEVAIGKKQNEQNPDIPYLQGIQFEICASNRYKANKKLPKIKALVDANKYDMALKSQYAQAKQSAQAETEDNEMEQKRQRGKTLYYGQIIQLKHVFTNKYLHVNTAQTSWTETSNLLVELLPQNSKRAQLKLLPRYKVKSEGDVIQISDLVVFESVKSPGRYLHCSLGSFSSTMVYRENHELNLSVSQSGFSVLRSDKADGDESGTGTQRIIKAGSIIQLFHKEMEGYLSAEGVFGEHVAENVHLRIRPVIASNHKSLLPPTSAITCWQIEKQKSLIDCLPINWNENIRLQHITTRHYLALKDDKPYLTSSRNDPLTVFQLSPVSKRSEAVKHKSFVRLQHTISRSWIHAEKDKEYRRKNEADDEQMKWSKARLLKVMGKEQMMYNDAFTINMIPLELVKEIYYVSGMVPFLQIVREEFGQPVRFSSRQCLRIVAALKELKLYMFKNGVAAKERQKLLRNFKVVDILIDILHCNCKDPETLEFMESVDVECYAILQVYLKGFSAKNELYMGRHIDFFQGQISDESKVGAEAVHMLMELLKDNESIIEITTKKQINSFIALIFKNKHYRYLELLSVLCIVRGHTNPANQAYIAEKWLVDSPYDGKNVVNYLSMGESINMDHGVLYISTDLKQHWVPLIRFLDPKSSKFDKNEYLFMEYQLRLFSALAQGRNLTAIDIIADERLLDFKMSFHCLKSDEFPDEFRAICAANIRDLFVDIGSNYSNMERVQLVFDYEDIVLPGQTRKTRGDSILSGCESLPFAGKLKGWISDFLGDNKSMIANNVERNHLIKEVLRLVYSLVDFGYYGDTEDVQKLLKPMFSLMDGRNDLPYSQKDEQVVSSDVQQDIEYFRKERRFRQNPNNNAVTDAKLQAMKVIELFFNFRFNTRLTRFIEEFKSVAENPDTDVLGPFLLEQDDDEEFRSNQGMHKVAMRELNEMFKETSYFGNEFVEILHDLLKYEEKEIVTESLLLLEDYFTANEDLFTRCIDTQLLLTKASRDIFHKTRQYLPQLKRLKKTLNQENVEIVIEILQDFIKMCCVESDLRESHPLNQEMLYNTGVLTDMMDMLTPFSVKSRPNEGGTEDKIRIQLLKQIFRFLKAFARGNTNIQERLFNRLEFLNLIKGAEAELGEVFIEIFNDNVNNCLRVRPTFIQEIVHRYSDSFHPVWLSVLSSMVIADVFPIKRNQNIVVKALMTGHNDKKSLAVITDTNSTAKLQILKGEPSSATEDIGRSGKHQLCSLVYLFSICAYGENKSIESICQCLLTMDDLLRFINMQSLCHGLRLAFLTFLTTGYMNSYSDEARNEIEKHGASRKLKDFLTESVETLQEGERIVQGDIRAAKELLRQRPSNLHRSKSDTTHEKKETLHYIFDGLVPFLRSVFEKHWGQHIPERPDLGADLLAALLAFAHAVHPALVKANHRTQLANTITLMAQTLGNRNVSIPQELNIKINTDSDARIKYNGYFKLELELNQQFDQFAENLLIAYEGENSVRQQIGHPSDQEYANQSNEEYLPLGKEFQDMVKSFKIKGKNKQKDHKYDISGLVKHLSWSMSAQRATEKRRVDFQHLDVKCMQILRAMIHNEFVRLPPSKKRQPQLYRKVMRDVEWVQDSLDDQSIAQAVMPHLARDDDKIVRECFNLLHMLYKSNKKTPENFVNLTTTKHEEAFFVAVQNRLFSASSLIKEKRFMLALHNRAMKENQNLRKNKPGKASRNQSRAQSRTRNTFKTGLNISNTFKNALTSKISPEERRNPGIELLKLSGPNSMRPLTKDGRLAVGNEFEKDDVPLIKAQTPPSTRGAARPSLDFGSGGEGRDEDPDFEIYHDFKVVRVILRTLSSLCDLELNSAQNLMREQPQNVKQVNLVSEVCRFLSLLYANIDEEYIELVTELLETMVELIQGNTRNQAVMFDQKVMDYINHMLRNSEYPGCNLDEILRFKGAIGTVIRFLTEENQEGHKATRPCQSQMIISAINKDGVWQTVQEFYDYTQRQSADKEQKETAANIGYLFFTVLLRSTDLGLYNNKDINKDPAWQFFISGSMSVEILKNDEIQRIYFRVADQSVLRHDVQDRLKWEVDRSSQGNKMRDFMAWIKDSHEDVQYQRKVHNNLIGRFLVKRWKFLNYANLLLTMMLNMVLILIWKVTTRRTEWLYHEVQLDWIWRVCGALHNLSSFTLVVSYFLSNLAGFASSKRTYITRAKTFRMLLMEKTVHERPSKLEVNLIGFQTLYYLMFFAFSVVGTVVSPAFFAFHLLQIVANNQLLMRVIRAVTVNGRSLLWVATMGVIIIYFYGLIGFMALRNVFLGNLHFCDNVWECTLTMFREGLLYRAMRLDYPVKLEADRIPDNASFTMYSIKLLFDLSFFVLVLTIGLNVIFGIIVDTFRQLRDAKWRIEQDIETRCFICGRNSYEFEQKGISFKYHCNQEHAVLAYVFFFVRLQDMPLEDLSHLEMYVQQQVAKENYNFFPMNRAIALDDEEDKEDEADEIMVYQLQDILTKLNQESEERSRETEKQRQDQWEEMHKNLRESPNRKVKKHSATSLEQVSIESEERRVSSPLPFRPVSKYNHRHPRK